LDNPNQNLGCPIKPAKQACPPHLRGGPYGRGGAPKALRSSGVNGAKSCILGISWHINLSFKYRFVLLKFLLDKSQGTQKLWIKRCKNMQSGHLCSFLRSLYSFWQTFLDFLPEALSPRSQTSTCLRNGNRENTSNNRKLYQY
jgi:hypothetical protein